MKNQKSVFETTCSRCGTHWVKYLISQTLGFREELPNVHDFEKPRGRIELYPKAILEKERADPGGYVYTYHAPLANLRVLEGTVNVLVVVRDPRDVCVSSVFYDIMKENITRSEFQAALKGRLSVGGPNPDFLKSYMELSSNLDHYLLRFEDMMTDPFLNFTQMLDFFGYAYEKWAVRKALEDNSFKKLSDGRKTGDENKSHHYRKGKVGDWMNYLSQKENESFLERHRDLMETWGYS